MAKSIGWRGMHPRDLSSGRNLCGPCSTQEERNLL